jgi:hypothetical protein
MSDPMDAKAQMEIEWACTKLVHDFAYYMDQRRYEDLAALFTPDGVFDRVGQPLRGRREIVDALAKRPLDQRIRHVTVGIHFASVATDAATAVVYNASYVGRLDEPGKPSVYAISRPALLEFQDAYRRTPDGWRIAERVARMVLVPEDMPAR